MEFSLLSFSRKTTPKIRLWKTSSGVRRNRFGLFVANDDI